MVTYLIKAGIAKERLSSEGFGETRPMCTEKSRDCRTKNRRTEFAIREIDGKSTTDPASTAPEAEASPTP